MDFENKTLFPNRTRNTTKTYLDRKYHVYGKQHFQMFFFFAIFAEAPSTHGPFWAFVPTPAKIEQYSLPLK
jgi:hypothetical protein